ncbi:PPIC-type PPIASE family protein [Burkholderiales bacterium JOSHI_001]|nr:PPIC-type PPIASE family protein [Burkholderiales bacterium JOSHI_001]
MHANPSQSFRTPTGPRRWTGWGGLLLALGWAALFVAEARAAEPAEVFATVGDTVVLQKDFDAAFATAARNKFYHGKPPEGEVARLQREVADNLINDILLAKEAKRRKLQPDHAAVQKEIDVYEQRYKDSAMWQQNKAKLLPPLRAKLEDNTLLEQLKTSARNVGPATDAQVQAYYEQNKDKFTEPEQVKVSMILLKVDPASPQAKWDGALEEGAAIVKRLRNGADFAQLAHLHSGDASAAKGGQFDYLHRGMLPDAAQAAVDKLQPGTISDAVALLEGVAIFRLDDRKPAKLNPLSAVRQRAQDLLQRERGDQAWAALLAQLREQTPTKVNDTKLLPLAAAPAPAVGQAKASTVK